MNAVISKAKEHFTLQATQSVDVPEWGVNGRPLIVYFKPLSIGQRRKIWRNEAGEPVDGTLAVVRAVMFQALDANGKRLFSDMDEHALTYEVDSEVVSSLGGRILGFVKGTVATHEMKVDDAKNV